MTHESLYTIRPRLGDELQHIHGKRYTYAGVNEQGTHFALDESGFIVAINEGKIWARPSDNGLTSLARRDSMITEH